MGLIKWKNIKSGWCNDFNYIPFPWVEFNWGVVLLVD